MSEPLSKVIQLERKEAQPAPHKFINTHEDYCEGYNDCLKDLDQREISVEALRKVMCQAETKYWKVEQSKRPVRERFIATYIASKMHLWIVKRT